MQNRFQGRFFSDLGMECDRIAMSACAENIVNTVVFEWFHFFHLFTDLVPCGRVLGNILVSFGDSGDTYSDFYGYGEHACISMIFE